MHKFWAWLSRYLWSRNKRICVHCGRAFDSPQDIADRGVVYVFFTSVSLLCNACYETQQAKERTP